MPKTAHGSMEHELKKLIKNFNNRLPYRIYVKDTKRRFVYCNTMMIRSLGCTTFAEVKGKRDDDFFSASHLREAIKAEERLLKPKGPDSLEPREEIETWKDGRLTRVITEKHAWKDKNGRRKGIIGYSHPIDLRDAAKIFPRALDTLGTVAGAYLGTYLTKLKRSSGSKQRFIFDNDNTWMDEIFKKNFPGRSLLERVQMIESADKKGVYNFLAGAKTRGLGYHDSVTFRARGKREIRATGVVFKDQLTQQLYFCVEHREVSKGLGRDALSNEILQRFPGYIFVKDRKRRFVYMNQPLLSCFGMKDISELARRGKSGGRPSDKDLGLSSRDRRIYERGDRAILDEKETMHISEDEVIALTPDPSQKNAKGEKIHVSTIKMPIPGHWFDPNQSKDTVYVLGIAWKTNNIFSKLHDKQMLWDTLLANAAEIIYSKTLDGKYQEVSTSFVDLRGWPKADIVGRKARDVWSENKSEALKMIEEDKKIEQDKKPIHNIIRTIVSKDGKKMEVRSQKFPILDEAGQIRLILGISRF